jgi:FkbM family methyltransferase
VIAISLKKTTLSILHRIIDRPPFSGRSILMNVSRRIGRGETEVYLRPGFTFLLDLDKPYHLLIFCGNYESLVLRAMRRVIHPGDLFVDGGANIGLHSLVAATCVGDSGHVWAFEPDPMAYPIAKANIDLNPRLRDRVTLIQKALSRRTEALSLVQAGHSQLESHAVRLGDGESGSQLSVTACRVDDAVSNDYQPQVAIMKLDIEGFEMEALAGATEYLARPNVIIISEINDPMLRKAGTSAADLVAFLRGQGFSSRTIEGASFEHPDPSWPEFQNAIFYRGPEAQRRVEAARGPLS